MLAVRQIRLDAFLQYLDQFFVHIAVIVRNVQNNDFLMLQSAGKLRRQAVFIRMRRKTSPFTAEISGEDCEAVLKTFNFSQAYFAAQYIAE